MTVLVDKRDRGRPLFENLRKVRRGDVMSMLRRSFTTRFRAANVGAAVASAALLATAATLVALPAGAAAAGCSVNYAVASQWQGGFTGNVSITNLGDPLTGWTLTWSFGAGQTVTQSWNTSLTQSG